MCHINILSKLDFSRRSAVQFGLEKHVKNTGILVFTGILMAVYRYSVFAISIHSITSFVIFLEYFGLLSSAVYFTYGICFYTFSR